MNTPQSVLPSKTFPDISHLKSLPVPVSLHSSDKSVLSEAFSSALHLKIPPCRLKYYKSDFPFFCTPVFAESIADFS